MNRPSPTAAAVIVAAGSSTRMGTGAGGAGARPRKPLLELDGLPVIEHTVRAFDAAPSVAELILVAHADDVERFERFAAERRAFAKVRGVVPGGAERADSVRIGVGWCAFDVDVICVHDAARPLVSPDTIERAVAVAAREGAALVARPVADTIKVVDGHGRAERTLDRSLLWAAQTPQAFRAADLRELTRRAAADALRPTDDAALWEVYRGPVPIVEGSARNLKITTPDELRIAQALLRAPVRAEEPA